MMNEAPLNSKRLPRRMAMFLKFSMEVVKTRSEINGHGKRTGDEEILSRDALVGVMIFWMGDKRY